MGIIRNYYLIQDKIKYCQRNRKEKYCCLCLTSSCTCTNKKIVDAKEAIKIGEYFSYIIEADLKIRNDIMFIDGNLVPKIGSFKTLRKIAKIKPSMIFRVYPRYPDNFLACVLSTNKKVISFDRNGEEIEEFKFEKRQKITNGIFWGYWIDKEFFPFVLFKKGMVFYPNKFSKFIKKDKHVTWDNSHMVKFNLSKTVENIGKIYIPITNSYDIYRRLIYKV